MPHNNLHTFKTQFLLNNPAIQAINSTDEHRKAAVLILVYPSEDKGLELVLTKRSDSLSNHAGQISFPGGSLETQDKDHTEAAVREAEEEIGLESSQVEVLGTMGEVLLPSGFAVTPVVAVMERAQLFIADTNEVAEIFSIPLSLVLDQDLYQQKTHTINNIKRNLYSFDYKEYYVWGATAGMLRSLAQLMA